MARRLLAPLLVLVPCLAAVEAVLVRARLPWRIYGPELLGQAALLWLALGLLALLPAALVLALLDRRARRARGEVEEEDRARSHARGRAAGALALVLLLPVVAHATLDAHVGPERDLSALEAPGAWLALAAAALATAVAAAAVAWLVRRVRPRRLVPAVLGAALVLGLVPPPGLGSERRGADDGGAGDRPNLLLLVWDTTRSDKLTPYGHDRETTPHLARLAEDALVFENATSASAFTFSSHLSMLSGVYPSTHGARLLSRRYDPRRARTVAEELRRAGYRTGGFVGTDVLAGRTGIHFGFEVYDDRVDPALCDTRAWGLVHDLQAIAASLAPSLARNGNPHWFQDFQRPGEEVLASALRWIERDDPRPWFCLVNLYDVHWPYLPSGPGRALVAPYDGPLDGYLFRSDRWTPGYEPDERDRRHVVELYEGELLELDLAVDRFLARVGVAEGETAVLVTSDHGEAFGEGGRWKHEDIGEPEVRIPMILRPAVPAGAAEGRRVARRVTGVDVAPTLLDLAGLETPPGTEGESLLAVADAELSAEDLGVGPRPVLVEDRDHVDPTDVRIALYLGHWKLVRRGLGDEERFSLFDLAADPSGETDVAAEHPEVLAELQALLAERRAGRDEADAEVLEGGLGPGSALQQLGYVGGDEEDG